MNQLLCKIHHVGLGEYLLAETKHTFYKKKTIAVLKITDSIDLMRFLKIMT